MNVKKFSANTSREAWRMVREALGPDAVILSNRTVNGAVEILALAGEDMSSLAEPAVEKEALSPSALAAFPGSRKRTTEAQPFVPAERIETAHAAVPAREQEMSAQELKALMGEIRSMRGML